MIPGRLSRSEGTEQGRDLIISERDLAVLNPRDLAGIKPHYARDLRLPLPRQLAHPQELRSKIRPRRDKHKFVQPIILAIVHVC